MNEIKPYDRQEGEPNRWYDRFHYFMRLGSGRSLARCYRDIINAERSTQGRPMLPRTAKCPGVWRQRAAQYDWIDRAEAWDQEQRRLSLEQVKQTLRIARALTSEALYIQRDVMRGELKNPDGTLTEGQNCTQRRLAAENIMDRAGAVHDPKDDREEVHLGDLPVNGIKIFTYSEEGIEIAEQIRPQVEKRNQQSPTREGDSPDGPEETVE